jgi:hypothetical protein
VLNESWHNDALKKTERKTHSFGFIGRGIDVTFVSVLSVIEFENMGGRGPDFLAAFSMFSVKVAHSLSVRGKVCFIFKVTVFLDVTPRIFSDVVVLVRGLKLRVGI